MKNVLLCSIATALVLATQGQSLAYSPTTDGWNAQWIGVIGGSKPNSWLCFRKTFEANELAGKAVARIACDSKYWLWINGELVVFEGQLKRGPTPKDTYYDMVDLSAHLRKGPNTVAVLVWHFGRHGFSHNSSGKAALLFDADVNGVPLVSDNSWRVRVHPAFGTTDPPLDNVRQPEANVRFDARHDIGAWQAEAYDDSHWGPPTVFGRPPTGPWNELYERPIPMWSDSGLTDYANTPSLPREGNGEPIVCRLPYNAQVTPYLKVDAEPGRIIEIYTDVTPLYGRNRLVETHRHEFVTRAGQQEFELPAWINGHEVLYVVPDGVTVLDLKYRETAYDTELVGSFWCDDQRLNQLWREATRTLHVTLRDTYMDCPDRERAQWWGDAVIELGEAFYALEPTRAPQLTRKAIYELARWQRPDGTLYSPVPSGIRRDGLLYPLDGSWDQELPRQMLASVGWYGFWTYYWYTGDRETLVDVYPAVRRYLSLWRIGDDGLVEHRSGGWDWTDWGEHKDVPVIENAWAYLALKAAREMAPLCGSPEDSAEYERKMASIEQHFNNAFWQGDSYRSPSHAGPTDDRANAMAVVAGLASPEQYEPIAGVLRREQHASPYMEKYVLEAQMLMDRPTDALDRMVSRYRDMLADDKTTLWELFDVPEQRDGSLGGSGTYNHAWSGGPLTVLSQYVAGVAPTAPGYEEFEVRPNLGRLKRVNAVTPTLRGPISIEASRPDTVRFEITIDSPAGSRGVASLPVPTTVISYTVVRDGRPCGEDGRPVDAEDAGFIGVSSGRARFALTGGKTHFTVTTVEADSQVSTEEAAAPPNTLSDVERAQGFQLVFDGKSLDGWVQNGNWRAEDGAIYRAEDGGFLTNGVVEIPEDFELRFEWRVAEKANSGVYYRPGQYEYQILDNKRHSDGKNPRTSAASLYFCVAPSRDRTRPAGEWNAGRVVCKGTVVQHWLNGEKVVHLDYADPKWATDVARLKELGGDLTARGGRLHLQDHGDPVWFRSIKLRSIPANEAIDAAAVTPARVPDEMVAREQAILASRRAAKQ